jgi:predicted TIM-barrel fold metal-dependent hydrolase
MQSLVGRQPVGFEIAGKDAIIVGAIWDLEPGKPDFRKHLERFRRNPLFRGIRSGDLGNGYKE